MNKQISVEFIFRKRITETKEHKRSLFELQHTSATIVYRLGSRLPRSSKNPGVPGVLGESGVVGLMGTEGKSTPERLMRRGWTRISCTSPTKTEGMTKNRSGDGVISYRQS